MTTIYFDMDGTIANLYGVNGWLADLQDENPRPYKEAKPLINFSIFAKTLHKVQKKGYRIGIITWLSKNSTEAYDMAVADTKRRWLKKHLPSVTWDEIHILKYGTPKSTCGNGILFDDEKPNREDWKGTAYNVDNIIETLKALAQLAGAFIRNSNKSIWWLVHGRHEPLFCQQVCCTKFYLIFCTILPLDIFLKI